MTWYHLCWEDWFWVLEWLAPLGAVRHKMLSVVFSRNYHACMLILSKIVNRGLETFPVCCLLYNHHQSFSLCRTPSSDHCFSA